MPHGQAAWDLSPAVAYALNARVVLTDELEQLVACGGTAAGTDKDSQVRVDVGQRILIDDPIPFPAACRAAISVTAKALFSSSTSCGWALAWT